MKKYEMYDLKKASYIKIGCKAKNFIEVYNEEELKEAVSMNNPKILGGMSNVLFAGDSYENTFISLQGEFKEIERISDTDVRAGAGVMLSSLLSFLAENGLSGLEELSGIPGSLGGMLFMNAGANGVSISDLLVSFDTLENKNLKKDECVFSYRHSSIKEPVEFVTLRLKKDSKENIKNKMSDIINKRKMTQPYDTLSLGCVFKNPAFEIPAWKLIDSVGMRSKCVNDVCVSEKHSNFIINKGDGKASDFLSLSEEIVKLVWENYNVKLEYEIEILF